MQKKKKSNHGKTALYKAAWNGHDAVVRLLPKHKADVDTKTKDGWTAVHWAASNGHETVVRQLLETRGECRSEV
jgi:ankyrin repeat protein